MSYDLWLVRREALGDDPTAAFDRLAEGEEEAEPREPTPQELAELHALAAELQAASPGLDVTGSEGVLQLGYDAERPLVVDLSPGESMLGTMSWSYGAADATAALAEVRLYLPVFERHGYVAYDPQLERIFESGRDDADARAIHDKIHDDLVNRYGSGRRPWWRRLLGSGS